MEKLGGLETYQRASLFGSEEGKFNSSRWVLEFLRRKNLSTKLSLLDVGALKNYYSSVKWIDEKCIDLNPINTGVEKFDFFDFPETTQYDVLVMSLVINFVGDPRKRGEMLVKCRNVVKPDGYLFVILPLSCIGNSRYLKHGLFVKILESLGFELIENKNTAKLSFYIFQKTKEPTNEEFKREICRGGTDRNNFCIILSNKRSGDEYDDEMEDVPVSKPIKKSKSPKKRKKE